LIVRERKIQQKNGVRRRELISNHPEGKSVGVKEVENKEIKRGDGVKL